ncbi:MAG: PEP-CTERM sorting domain-containing protein [Pirellulaceae bacterium]
MSAFHHCRLLNTALVLAVSFLLTSASSADFTMNIYPHSAPNVFGSPSWPGFVAIGMPAIDAGTGDVGDRNTDPTAYDEFAMGEVINVTELIVSAFPSWRGLANPAAPFDMERGNRLHFGLNIIGDGVTQFRLEDLSVLITSDDAGNALGFGTSFAGTTFSDFRIGVDYGIDRMRGGGDDTMYMSGEASTTLIDELIYIGAGNAFDASFEPGTDQEKIYSVISAVVAESPITVTGEYFLDDTGGSPLISGSNFVVIVPEPGSLIGLGLFSVACIAHRRRRR